MLLGANPFSIAINAVAKALEGQAGEFKVGEAAAKGVLNALAACSVPVSCLVFGFGITWGKC